jgi:hypothetical protein
MKKYIKLLLLISIFATRMAACHKDTVDAEYYFTGQLSCLLFNAVGVEKKLESASFTFSFVPWQL